MTVTSVILMAITTVIRGIQWQFPVVKALTAPVGFSSYIVYSLNEYLKVPSGPLCYWTQDVSEFGRKLGGSQTLAEMPLFICLIFYFI